MVWEGKRTLLITVQEWYRKKGAALDLGVAAMAEACLVDSEEEIGFYSKDSGIHKGFKAGQLCSLSLSLRFKWMDYRG